MGSYTVCPAKRVIRSCSRPRLAGEPTQVSTYLKLAQIDRILVSMWGWRAPEPSHGPAALLIVIDPDTTTVVGIGPQQRGAAPGQVAPWLSAVPDVMAPEVETEDQLPGDGFYGTPEDLRRLLNATGAERAELMRQRFGDWSTAASPEPDLYLTPS